MALITCPECGRQISDRASVCIGCGIPMEEIRKMLEEAKAEEMPEYEEAEEGSAELLTLLKSARQRGDYLNQQKQISSVIFV